MATSNILERPFINITNIIWSFNRATNQVNILLVKRDNSPYNQFWALPETFMRLQESADEAALRLVKEKIGMELSNSHTEQLATFTNKLRTPKSRALSLAYMTFLPDKPHLEPGYGAVDAKWFAMGYTDSSYRFSNGLLAFQTSECSNEGDYYDRFAHNESKPETHLAFDHEWILKIACDRIKNKLDYQPNILLVLGASFTLKDARMVYSPFLKTPINQIDNSNFKKSHRHLFTAVGTSADNRPGRPARVYKLAFIGA
ncbi:NrtR DNA-binding winged helix domain-containing protein [Lentilactobacillus kisonensis]|uniref:Hydrolase, NUDIX family n=1 Tax=Lentilactobacillus kisonensis F0435 TaxID=797516 RepID=H1LCF8_9LACO|nr:NUDIX domain-containing protein [Lentilactobacillus kisonensis]EHO54103.1 hydrolase, NUDIX family [Lentilactobacillus kisonensis F0435]